MSAYEYAVYQDRNRHTCIMVAEVKGKTDLIPMNGAEFSVMNMDARQFHDEFTPMPDYPVKRAAESYTSTASSLSISVTAKAREHLDRILADPSLEYDRSLFHPIPKPKKEIIMKKDAPVAAADKATKNAAAKKAPAKKEAMKAPTKAPAKQAAKASVGKGEGGDGGTRESKYADKKITKKADHAARSGSLRAAILDKILKAKNTNDVLGVEVSDASGNKSEAIGPGHIGWAVSNGLIQIA